MADAMIFIAVIMIAASVTLTFADSPQGDDRDAPAFLKDLLGSEVRMSDLSDGDDSVVTVSDLMALELYRGEGSALEYAAELLSAFARGRPCTLEVEFLHPSGEAFSRTLGSGGTLESVSYRAEVPVSTGGTLSARITLFASRA